MLDDFADLSDLQKKKLRDRYDHLDKKEDYFLLHSGILSLEVAIKSYIEKYAFPIKMRKLLRAFKSILEEINEANKSYLEQLDEAKKIFNAQAMQIKDERTSTANDKKKKRALEDARREMDKICADVKKIKVEEPKIDDIRKKYMTMKEDADCFFGKRPDGSLVKNYITHEEAGKIRENVVKKINELANELKDLVDEIRLRKEKELTKYAEKFDECLEILRKKGLLSIGSFNIENTVEYKDIIGDGAYTKYEACARDVDNPDKGHIEIGDGLLNFFASIRRSVVTIFEPSQVKRIDVQKYHSMLFQKLDGNVADLIDSVERSYREDIEKMHNEEKCIDYRCFRCRKEHIGKCNCRADGCGGNKRGCGNTANYHI